jgi:hypothetical protein
MAAYDPKRTRPVAAPDPVSEPAPIDALLETTSGGEEGSADVVDLRGTRPVDPTPAPAEASPAPDTSATEPAPAGPRDLPPVLSAPPPDKTVQRVAVVAGVAAATTTAILLWRRWRRR